MPKEAEDRALQELKRLESMPPMSAEATVSRNYLDWLIAVPWRKRTRERKDLLGAETILNEDHYGLEKVKERIVEFLAVRQLVNKPKGPILCFVGPPGVGKTSLAKSIARCTNRKFVRHVAGRRARRGRGARPPPHLHRRLPRPDHPDDEEGGRAQPGLPAGRGRQDVDGLPRRPVGGAAGGARPRAEPQLHRPLPGRRVRPVVGVLHRHRERAAHHPAAAAGPHGGAAPPRLHRAREGRDREAPPDHEADRVPRPRAAATSPSPTRRCTDVIRRYTREAGVRSMEREISSVFRKVARKVVLEGKAYSTEVTEDNLTDLPGRAALPRSRGRRSATRSASPPASPGPRWAARSCPSRSR